MNDIDKLTEEIAELSRQIRRNDIIARLIAYILGSLIVLYTTILVCSIVWQ